MKGMVRERTAEDSEEEIHVGGVEATGRDEEVRRRAASEIGVGIGRLCECKHEGRSG